MGNTYLLSAAANQRREDRASRCTVARRLICRYEASATAAEAIAVTRQRDRHGIEIASRSSRLPASRVTPSGRTASTAPLPAPRSPGRPSFPCMTYPHMGQGTRPARHS
jgi:hypothetical protein